MHPLRPGSPFRLVSHVVLPAFVLLLGLVLATTAQALTPAEIEAGNQAAKRIQQEQQERQQQQLREDALRKGKAQEQEAPKTKAPSLPKSGVCRDIKEIALQGAALLSEDEKRGVVGPYLNRCLYAEDIEALLADVLKLYMDRGYISVRPYVQAQDLSKGRLEILIVEGTVQELILKEDGKWLRSNLATAFPFVAGKPLNLRDIEQGLDQINRLASNSATMEVSPGSDSGQSVVTITNTPKLPFSASGTLDNMGGLSTGRNQGAYTVSLDNPTGLNDFITYTHRNTLFEQARYRDSVSDSFFYSLPLGYATMQLSYSASDYHSPVVTSSTVLVARGNSETFRAEVNYVAYRDQNQKLTLLAALNNKSTRSYLEDEFLAVSSRNLSIADVDANWSRRFEGFIVNLGLGLSQGLRQFNAKVDEEGLPVNSPHAQAAKLRYSAGLVVPFSLLGQEASFSSQLSGQYALEQLYGSEQITIGSFYTVRGFNRNSLAGDRGWYVRNELGVALPKLPFTDIVPRPFIGFDGGRIEGWRDTIVANLTGAVAGVRFSGSHVTAELSAAKSISCPYTIQREPVQFVTTLTVSF